MIIQIYEITSVDEALRISGLGVDHIGVVVGDSGNIGEVRSYKAKEIFLAIPKEKKGVALTLSSDLSQIGKLVTECEPDILYIASSLESIMPEDLESIKKEFPNMEIMRTIPVVGEESVVAAMMYDNLCDYILLDSKDLQTGRVGVTGVVHDWNISKKIVESVSTKVILAGGLGPENVKDAINAVRPFGVDSKTKTDKIGGREKDLIKVKMFVDRAKSVIL